MSQLGPSWRPLRFLTDANFNMHIVAGLRRREPTMDTVTAKPVGLLKAPDPEILIFAKEQDRILLTHDRATMPIHLDALLRGLPQGEHSAGVMSVEQQLPIGAAIEAIVEVWACSSHDEWRDQFTFLPL